MGIGFVSQKIVARLRTAHAWRAAIGAVRRIGQCRVMATEKQIEANRSNALRSTGPRTADSKKATSGNALSHGLFATDVAADGEDPRLCEALLEVLLEEHEPQTATETFLVGKIALALWREKRLVRAERNMMDESKRISSQSVFGSIVGGKLDADVDASTPTGILRIDDNLLLGRYQTMLGNQIRQALRDLRDEKAWPAKTIDVTPDAQMTKVDVK